MMVTRDYEHRSMSVNHHGRRDSPEERRLNTGQPSGADYDGLGIEFLGDVTNGSPDLALHNAGLRLEAGQVRQFDAARYRLVRKFSGDLIEAEGV